MKCPACDGEDLVELGVLGNRRHYRCRTCGIGCDAECDDVTCAICVERVPRDSTTREPLGKGNALVVVCSDCNTRDAGDGYSFEGSTGKDRVASFVERTTKRQGPR